jgi:uncharacterized protein (DUF1810 family)
MSAETPPGDPNDPFDLARFVKAQAHTYDEAVRELRAGAKRSHWMWFIFPQVLGLGHSDVSRRYAIRNLDEAGAYISHAVLGPRLVECTSIVNGLQGRSAWQIFGSPDDLKFVSCMTLFELVAGPHSVFAAAVQRFAAGVRDAQTIALVHQSMRSI